MGSTVYARDTYLVHARIGPVVITQIEDGHGEPSFDLYLKALERELSERPSDDKVAVVYYVPSGGTWEALQRRRINAILERFLTKRRKTTSVWILCTPSAATRGVVTALFWLSKPPYESRTKATLEQALEEIRLFHPEVSARDFTAELKRITRSRP